MDHLTSVQLSEWEAYDKIDPIGTWREDFRMAFLASLITNLTISIHGKKGSKMVELEEYMPNWTGEEKPVKVQSIEEMKAAFEMIVKAQGKNSKVGIHSKDRPPIKKKNG